MVTMCRNISKIGEEETCGIGSLDGISSIMKITEMVEDTTFEMANKLKVDELRAELAKRGLSNTGTKPSLVRRLESALKQENKQSAAGLIDVGCSNKTRERESEDGGEDSNNGPEKIKGTDKFRDMNVKQLREQARLLGVSTAGTKNKLLDRLCNAEPDNYHSLQPIEEEEQEQGEKEKEKIVTATRKGAAVLDQYLSDQIKSEYHVLQIGDDVYDAMLNQTNVGDNNNKFYVIQLLGKLSLLPMWLFKLPYLNFSRNIRFAITDNPPKLALTICAGFANIYSFFPFLFNENLFPESDDGGRFMVYNRWGRVGVKGQDKLFGPYTSRDLAISEFEQKFYAKTKNCWSERKELKCYPKCYTWLEMDYSDQEKEPAAVKEKPNSDIAIQPRETQLDSRVAKFVSLICNASVMKHQMMEIGGLFYLSINPKGYDVLKRISDVIGTADRVKLEQLSGEFYTVIPHDFGCKKMREFVIDTPQKLKCKLEMVGSLSEIEVATKLLEDEPRMQEDPLYSHYNRLHCELTPVEVDSKEFSMFSNTENRMLLWHGSRLTNWIGILSQGLRIAPPEAPVTGCMFGKGVYFADMFSNSANYCYATSAAPAGVLLLCEVALGDMAELLQAKYDADKLPSGKLSTKGVGGTAPDISDAKVLDDGVVVPLGKPKQQRGSKGSLLYNEYIVYNVDQIRMRYVVQRVISTVWLNSNQLETSADGGAEEEKEEEEKEFLKRSTSNVLNTTVVSSTTFEMANKLKVDELRAELAKRGLSNTGTKPYLVRRLESALKQENKQSAAGLIDVGGGNKKRERESEDGGEDSNNGPEKIKATDKFRDMNVKQLREQARLLGVSTAGTKNKLLDRLCNAEPDNHHSLQPIEEEEQEQGEKEKEKIVTATRKGSAVLDQYLSDQMKSEYHVLQIGDDVYDAMLNQTNVGDNNNKFYVIQLLGKLSLLPMWLFKLPYLNFSRNIRFAITDNPPKLALVFYLKSDDGGRFMVYNRWGRVGVKGQDKLFGPYTSRDPAVSEFEQKFYAKTKNCWSERKEFKCYPKCYAWLEMDYSDQEKEPAAVKEKPNSAIAIQPRETQLESRVAKFVSLICNVSMMKQQMMEIGYNANKLPLGKLSKLTILKGYDVLKRISDVIGTADRLKLEQLSGEFYTVIPHDFGFKKMREFVIDTPQKLKCKLEMVESLSEIEVATKLLEDEPGMQEDPLYSHYNRLHCELTPVEVDSKEFYMNTHAKTHSQYTVNIAQIFRVSRDGENERFKKKIECFYGTARASQTGLAFYPKVILSCFCLRIAPPEAPVTGYMFGKGVYFADMFSKSANYCYATSAAPAGVLLLCEKATLECDRIKKQLLVARSDQMYTDVVEQTILAQHVDISQPVVALGDMAELLQAKYDADKLPSGKLSTKGVGGTAPDISDAKVLEDGVVVPLGKPKQQRGSKGSLLYNEYIVYNVDQIRMRYVVQVNFKYKH
ncbi:unnamed protein product [Dovyalis caffra]|uniref:Poly [ADP-ribose] polymerase n=1 Tax=Dovyalis caffra TaxID=77055 RepID=A0AAV1SDS6_9ROSI|nr:unnamed protein product [Dovyalis caffra]